MTRGHTLLELAVAMLLAATLAGSLLPAARRYRDRFAVVSAREELAGLVASARARAPGSGGASLRLVGDPWRAWIEVADSAGPPVQLEERYGVVVTLPDRGHEAVVSFDGLGLGRVASLTLRITRNGAEAGLTLSSYGRVRRW